MKKDNINLYNKIVVILLILFTIPVFITHAAALNGGGSSCPHYVDKQKCDGTACSMEKVQCTCTVIDTVVDTACNIACQNTCEDGPALATCFENCTLSCTKDVIDVSCPEPDDNCACNSCGKCCCNGLSCGALNNCGDPCGSVSDPGCETKKACAVAYCDKPGVEWFCIKTTQYIPILDKCPDKQCIGPADCGGGGGCDPSCVGLSCGAHNDCGDPCGSASDPGCTPTAGKCGLDSENYLVCKLDGTGTGINCNSNSDCNCIFTIHLSGPTTAKPFQAISYTATPTGGQGNIAYRWSIDSAVVSGVTGTILNRVAGFPVGTYLISVRGTDSTGATATDSLTLDVSDDGGNCIINSASAVPAYPKIIYLGGKFKVTWQTTDCSTCTITCNTLDKCGVNGLVQPVGGSGEIEVKPTSSGYYAYKITCDGGAGGASSIVLPSTDVWDGVSSTLKTNVGAYRVRRPFIFETPAFLKLLIDKLF